MNRKIMKHLLLIIIFLFMNHVALATNDVPLIIELPPKSPTIEMPGIQFDRSNSFISNNDGAWSYYTTDNSGYKWNNFEIKWSNAESRDAKLLYYYQGNGIVSLNNGGVFLKDYGKNFVRLFDKINSIVFRGKYGFRLDKRDIGEMRLYKTFDGGCTWSEIQNTDIWFNHIDAFDIANNNLIFACVSIEDKNGKFLHYLANSSNFGKKWMKLCNVDSSVGIWPTHIFFINNITGWISSDRDDGLFATEDSGKTWKKINTPERFVSAIFFTDKQNGLIITGPEKYIYQTMDGGLHWSKINNDRIRSEKFLDHFRDQELKKWSDFLLYYTVIKSK